MVKKLGNGEWFVSHKRTFKVESCSSSEYKASFQYEKGVKNLSKNFTFGVGSGRHSGAVFATMEQIEEAEEYWMHNDKDEPAPPKPEPIEGSYLVHKWWYDEENDVCFYVTRVEEGMAHFHGWGCCGDWVEDSDYVEDFDKDIEQTEAEMIARFTDYINKTYKEGESFYPVDSDGIMAGSGFLNEGQHLVVSTNNNTLKPNKILAYISGQPSFLYYNGKWANPIPKVKEEPVPDISVGTSGVDVYFDDNQMHLAIMMDQVFMRSGEDNYREIDDLNGNKIKLRDTEYTRVVGGTNWDLYYQQDKHSSYQRIIDVPTVSNNKAISTIEINGEAFTPTSGGKQINTNQDGSIKKNNSKESSSEESSSKEDYSESREQISSSLAASGKSKQGNKLQLDVKESGFELSRGSNSGGHRLDLSNG